MRQIDATTAAAKWALNEALWLKNEKNVGKLISNLNVRMHLEEEADCY